jgi:hypothetical protein
MTKNVESTRMRVVRKETTTVYVFCEEFKVIFLMLVLGFELMILGLHVLRLIH